MIEGGCDIVSGGTDTHLMLVDLRKKGLTGKAAEAALGRAYITCNKNGIPVRPGKADGHLGHPARHAGRHDARLRRGEFREVGELIIEVLDGLAKNGEAGQC